jgi:hypothetical protein
MASFLSDGIVVGLIVVLLNTSLDAMYISLKEFDLIVLTRLFHKRIKTMGKKVS